MTILVLLGILALALAITAPLILPWLIARLPDPGWQCGCGCDCHYPELTEPQPHGAPPSRLEWR